MSKDLPGLAELRLRRSKLFRRQSRVAEEREVRKQASEPAPPPAPPAPGPTLVKHRSYPQYAQKNRRWRTQEDMNSMLFRAVTVIDRQASTSSETGLAGLTGLATQALHPVHARHGANARHTGHSGDVGQAGDAGLSGLEQRASHVPAMRDGPPLSCNFCWNTVDECGRILRRKTQYHCPECRTNLCIVPCFHEFHDEEAQAAR